MILAIIIAVLAYRKAQETGRNGLVWAAAGAAVWVGAQLIVSIGAGIFFGVGMVLFDWPEAMVEEAIYVGPVTAVSIGASVLASWLLLRYLGKPLNDDPVDLTPPPPPPTFNQDQ